MPPKNLLCYTIHDHAPKEMGCLVVGISGDVEATTTDKRTNGGNQQGMGTFLSGIEIPKMR